MDYKYKKLSAHQIIPENIFLHDINISNPQLLQIEISPTDSCNQECNWCFTSDARVSGKSLTSLALKKYIQQFKDKGGISVVFSGGGEPLLQKYMYKKMEVFQNSSLIEYCLNLGLTCGLITNGILLHQFVKNVDITRMAFIRISVDHLNKLEYANSHGCSTNQFYRLINNIILLSKIRHENITPAFGISFIVDEDTNLNYSFKDLLQIRNFVHDKNIDFVQFKHLHTNNVLKAEQEMKSVHKKLLVMDWSNVEFWVQKYFAPKPKSKCFVTQYIQSLGGNDERYPCCHLFGDTSAYQNSFYPEGKIILDCKSRVCRYISINKLLENIETNDHQKSVKILQNSISVYGYHPYRLFPTAPDLYFPVSNKQKTN